MKRLVVLCMLVVMLLTSATGCTKRGGALSPYDVAVEQGFTGSEQEWLDSLKGDSAYDLWLKAGNVGTFDDFLASLSPTIHHHQIHITTTQGDVAVSSKALLSVVSVNSTFSQGVSTYSGAGSGVIYQLDKVKGDAYIITNFHVIYDSDSKGNGISDDIKVSLYGMEHAQYAIPATYVGGSVYYDIAVLKVRDSEVLRQSDAMAVSLLAESENVSVGQTAIAVGNPEALGISVTKGIVCVDSESIALTTADESATVTMRVIRIDTPINPGNSGGGLFDAEGRLIGITNAKIIDVSTESIGYAIPVKVATRVADNIIDYCADGSHTTMQRCVLGVTLGASASKAIYDIKTGKVTIVEAVTVTKISQGSLVEGKIKVDDIILSVKIDGKIYKITRTFMLVDAMLNVRVGDVVEMVVLGDGKEVYVNFTITEDCVISY